LKGDGGGGGRGGGRKKNVLEVSIGKPLKEDPEEKNTGEDRRHEGEWGSV